MFNLSFKTCAGSRAYGISRARINAHETARLFGNNFGVQAVWSLVTSPCRLVAPSAIGIRIAPCALATCLATCHLPTATQAHAPAFFERSALCVWRSVEIVIAFKTQNTQRKSATSIDFNR